MPHTKASQQARAKVANSTIDSSNFDAWFTPARMLLILFGLMCVTFPDVFFQGHVFSYRDAGIFNYPSAYFVRESWLRGEVPLWNPYNNCGIPFLAQWNVMALYPPSLIYIFLPVPWAITFFSLAHFFLAAAGMFFLARRWTENQFAATAAAILFAWNGITLHSLMWPNSCAAIGWMPWVIFLAERAFKQGGRTVILAALVGAMQMLAGVPEIILITWLITGALWALIFFEQKQSRGKILIRAVFIGVLVTGLTAAQMLPFFDLLAHSQRNSSYGVDKWALPPWGFANYIVPLFRSSPDALNVYTQDEQQWSSSYYLGIVTIALAIFAARQFRNPRVLLLIVLAVIGSVFALGKNGLAFDWVKKVVPILGVMRYPAKWTQVAMFCIPLLAAFGIARLQSNSDEQRRMARQSLLKIGFVLSTLLGIILAFAYLKSREDEPFQTAWQNGFIRLGFLITTLGVLANLSSRHPIFSPRTMALIALGLFGLDIAFHMPRQVPTVPGREWQKADLQMSEIPKPGESRAMLSAPAQSILRKASMTTAVEDFHFKRQAMHMDANLLDRVPKVNGLFSLYVKEAAEVDDQIYLKGEYSDGLFDFLGASQMSLPDEVTTWFPRENHLPLATVGAKPVFLNSGEALARIFSPRFNPTKNVFLPKEAEGEISAKEPVSDAVVQQKEFSAQRINYTVKTPAPCVLTLAQTFYHPWKAFVDGTETKIWRANHAFQAVEIPTGEHEVKFVYDDRTFKMGAMISEGTVLGIFIAWFFMRKSKAQEL